MIHHPPSRPRLVGLLLFCFLFVAPRPAHAQLDAETIIQRAEAFTHGRSKQGLYKMTLIRPDWERTMHIRFWANGTQRTALRIVSEGPDQNVAFLKLGRDLWQYIPPIGRTVKLPMSMMLQPWMGSDFTHDDLTRQSSEFRDYSHELHGREQMDGVRTYKVTLTAEPDAVVAWFKIVMWVTTREFLPVRAAYYNERDELIRTLVYTNISNFGGRYVPRRMELIDETRPGHRTLLELEEMRLDRPIDDTIFSLAFLRQP